MQVGRMQRKLIWVPLLAVALAAPFNMAGMAALGQSGMALLDTALRDPASLIAGRSPGARGDTLLQTKPGLSAARGTGPQERVLDEVRRRPGVAPAAPPAPSSADSIVIGPAQEDILPADLITGSASPNGIPGLADAQPLLAPVAGTGGGIPPVGGGGAGGGGGGGISPPLPAPVSPIPEPAVWIVMTLGFWLVGLGLRREKRRHSLPV